MRRAKKEIHEKYLIEEILKTAHVGRLGTIGKDGYPVVKPLNFVYRDGAVFFHSAKEGEKIEDIRNNNRICFEVDVPIRYIPATGDPCRAFYHYRSVILKGRAVITDDMAEKYRVLKALMEKYQPEGGYGEFPAEKVAVTAVIRIDIDEMTGKEDLQER